MKQVHGRLHRWTTLKYAYDNEFLRDNLTKGTMVCVLLRSVEVLWEMIRRPARGSVCSTKVTHATGTKCLVKAVMQMIGTKDT